MGKWAKRENETYMLSEESAEQAVRELLDFYEVDVGRSDPAQEEALAGVLEDLVKAYRRCELENKIDVTNGFCVVQHLKNGNEITYMEMKGKDRVCLEGLDESKLYSRIYALMGRLCRYGADAVEKLMGQDWKNAWRLAMVFIAASRG